MNLLEPEIVDAASKFAEWIKEEGVQEYDGFDRWINPSVSNEVFETKDLFNHFVNNVYKP